MNTVLQRKNEYICFAVFDNSKKLLYSKFNFKFQEYATQYILPYENTFSSKRTVFFDFLQRNESDPRYPFTVKDELKQYFSDITPDVQQYFDNYGYVLWDFNYLLINSFMSMNTIIENEFSLKFYDYDTEIPSILEFLYHDENGNIYSRYNFDFDNYSLDYNVFGSKLCVFSNFLLSMKYQEGNAPGFIGYNNIPENFKKYFDTSNNTALRKYLSESGIFSPFRNIKKNPSNIKYDKYVDMLKTKYYLSDETDIDDAKIYFFKYGQFQQDEIEFGVSMTSEIDNIKRSVCQVFDAEASSSGFLFEGIPDFKFTNGVRQIYLATCYHIIQNSSNRETVYAICYINEYSDSNNFYSGQEVKLLFRVLGYDKYTDVMVCLYDPELPYNKAKYDESQYHITERLQTVTLDIGMLSNYIGQEVVSIGSLGNITDTTYMTGKIIDDSFGSSFNTKFTLAAPSCILTDIQLAVGTSGSPLFIITKDGSNVNYKCIGMMIAKVGDNLQYSMAINNNIFNSVLSQTQAVWYYYKNMFGLDRINDIRFYTNDTFPKKWLGCVCSYFNPTSEFIKEYGELSNLNYIGGVLITDFILGFDTTNKKFVYNNTDLTRQDVIKIDTPLLKSDMYNKYFMTNGKIPILLKSLEFFDLINGNYNNFLLGKYSGQSTLDVLTYGFVQSASVLNDTTKYANIVKRKFLKIFMDYFYFDGENWIEVTEEFGGNDDSWYNEYKDKASNNVFLQHKIEYPIILTNYLEPFAKLQDDAELVGIFTKTCKECGNKVKKTRYSNNPNFCRKECHMEYDRKKNRRGA